MNNPAEPILKMRFRLPNGEEFEAEGTREFIERERNYFLALIGQRRGDVASLVPTTTASAATTPAPGTTAAPMMRYTATPSRAAGAEPAVAPTIPQYTPAPSEGTASYALAPSTTASHALGAVSSGAPVPAHTTPQQVSTISAPAPSTTASHALGAVSSGAPVPAHTTPQQVSTISAPAPSNVTPTSYYAPAPRNVASMSYTPAPSAAATGGEASYHTDLYLWERLLKEDGDVLILRRKARLTMAEFTTILIAGARVLLKKKSYSALEITKSLKASGGAIKGRLDRLLAPEIRAGRLIAQGAKRSRTYALTDEGFAKAFVLAEKLSNPDDSQLQEEGRNTWKSHYPPPPRKPKGYI